MVSGERSSCASADIMKVSGRVSETATTGVAAADEAEMIFAAESGGVETETDCKEASMIYRKRAGDAAESSSVSKNRGWQRIDGWGQNKVVLGLLRNEASSKEPKRSIVVIVRA